jgi:hypothetical protein
MIDTYRGLVANRRRRSGRGFGEDMKPTSVVTAYYSTQRMLAVEWEAEGLGSTEKLGCGGT